ncbi:putative Formate dehydrogenase formation protein FdhE [Pseudodesulfovibrio profundus]|uniref:Putative Formate dehydrogenase formation protein FdhE n=1 Tax=Pseudodesulfovibrio profundus TaxID=57320 RepID=A0A2C8FD28_9BACT|nr:formate dehydrogenase accessory protein FdhE [Pseudodesulfovibrio profundus]MBC16940.1 formate dehydrogenase [Desulfovibrio sp.]SOB60397.1 putative Formate dehydrogenase formation protein FdhE [Pseudodesulfovibrio profundus]|tara:strand:- start:489 stop:1403 length:915 start_codon:yes stop_codon:yes gene_type:complete
MKSAPALDTVEKTLESIRVKTPAYEELTERFGSLFKAAASVHDELVKRGIATADINQARVAAGAPVLAGNDMETWRDDFAMAAERLLPSLCEVLELESDVADQLIEYFGDADNVMGLVRARIDGDWPFFEKTSVQQDSVPPTVMLYISETISSPVLGAIVDTMDESLSSLNWQEGHCPACGSSPSISHLSPKEVTDLDQLVGGGGKKFLHCSLCGFDWRFKRNACPSCGNEDSETREVFYIDDVQYERIEACHQCGKYCLNIDMREFDPHPHLDAIQMGLIHLDLYARKNSLTPIKPTLWNTVE